jgi:phosphonate transport system substrate-binding protein
MATKDHRLPPPVIGRRRAMLWLATTPLLTAAVLSGCDEQRAQAPVERKSDGLTLAVHPFDTPSRLVERFQPLCDYLGEEIGTPVRVHVAISYEDQIRRIADGSVDLAYMGPTPYLRAHDKYMNDPSRAIEPIAGEEEYYSVFVVRRSSDITRIDDLKGKTVAFGSHRSFSSHYMPRALLMKHGLALGDLKDYAFLDRHERVALAVLHGDYDAGGVNRWVADKYMDQGAGLKVIAVSPPLPPHAIVARVGLGAELVGKVRRALLEPDEAGKRRLAAFGQPSSFVPVTDAQFDFARRIVAALENESRCAALPF